MAKIDPKEPCPCDSGKLFSECHEPLVLTNRPIVISKRIALKVIPEPDPDTRSVFMKTGEGTILIRGYLNEMALTCGKCSAPLVVGVEPEQIQMQSIVIRCNHCGSFNDTVAIAALPVQPPSPTIVLNRHERRRLVSQQRKTGKRRT